MSRTRLPAFDAVIFDMDGLLIDTEPTYAQAWKRAALALGVELDGDFLHSLFGHHAADVAQRLETELGGAFDLERFFAEAERLWYEQIEQYGIPLMPGAETILDMLKQTAKSYALATNSDSPFAGLCLERAGLVARFPIIVCRDEVAAGKPAPDLFIEAALRLGVPIGRCLVLEDSPTGILGANRAGAIPVLVSRRTVREETRRLARAVFSSLQDVSDLLRTAETIAEANGA